MKILGMREARDGLSEAIKLAKSERVIITNHGRPVALLVNIDGQELEALVGTTSPSFWAGLCEPGVRPVARPRKRPKDTARSHRSTAR